MLHTRRRTLYMLHTWTQTNRNTPHMQHTSAHSRHTHTTQGTNNTYTHIHAYIFKRIDSYIHFQVYTYIQCKGIILSIVPNAKTV